MAMKMAFFLHHEKRKAEKPWQTGEDAGALLRSQIPPAMLNKQETRSFECQSL